MPILSFTYIVIQCIWRVSLFLITKIHMTFILKCCRKTELYAEYNKFFYENTKC